MTDLHIPYEKQALTANGGADGSLTVTSTANFRKGARVWLASGTQTSVELVIDQIVDATHVKVRNPNVTGLAYYNCSAFLLADSAALFQNEQTDQYARSWNWF
jgi:hypothetical protein